MEARDSGHSTRFSRREHPRFTKDTKRQIKIFSWRTSSGIRFSIKGNLYSGHRGVMAFSSSIAIVFIGVAAYTVAAGSVQGIPNTLQRDEYGSPVLADLLARYLEDRNAGSRNLDGHLLRQARRGLDSLSGATFGENKRYTPLRRFGATNIRPVNFDEIDRSVFDRFSKRNIDEIDTAFDSFFKRNFDEIDRVGWSGFVKRLNNYLADKQRR